MEVYPHPSTQAGSDKTLTQSPNTLEAHENGAEVPFLLTVKQNPKRVLYVLLMIPPILLVGYDNVMVAALASMPYFDFVYGEFLIDPALPLGGTLFIPADWLGVWNGIGTFGSMCGSLYAGWMHERFGRKISLGFASILAALGIGVIYASTFGPTKDDKRGIFLVGKVIQGFAAGQVAATSQTYLSEITPTRLRGSVFAFFPAVFLTGSLISVRVIFGKIYVISDNGYKDCMLSMFAFSGAVLLTAFLIPESPIWLVRKGKMEAARNAQQRLEPPSDIDKTLTQLTDILEHEKQSDLLTHGASFRQCFSGTDARRTRIIILANSITNMFGINFLGASTYFYEILGMEPGLALKLLQVGLGAAILATVIAMWTTTRLSRRGSLIGTLSVVSLFWLAVGIAGCFDLSNFVTNWSASCMITIIFIAGLGAWPASVAVASEASSLQLRGYSQGIGWLWQNMLSGSVGIALPYIFTPDQGNSKGKIGFIFFGTSLLGALLSWLYVPEMRERSASDIDAMFEAKLDARKFGQWSSSRDGHESAMSQGELKQEATSSISPSPGGFI